MNSTDFLFMKIFYFIQVDVFLTVWARLQVFSQGVSGFLYFCELFFATMQKVDVYYCKKSVGL
jgi:hypothetical protein